VNGESQLTIVLPIPFSPPPSLPLYKWQYKVHI